MTEHTQQSKRESATAQLGLERFSRSVRLWSLLLSCCVSGLMLPGHALKRQRSRRIALPSLQPLSHALPSLLLTGDSPSGLSARPLPASQSAAPTSSASLPPSKLRSAKQRAALRAAEVAQLTSVCAFDSYRHDPLVVMREHLQKASQPHLQLLTQMAAQGRKERRKQSKAHSVASPR